ncbi:hypothetical protein [Micromonospora eburnea]|uniref:Uncharacterized protein n=1 Tax=Micromonospora eburnea TaxID=227316 RepID=A0A1C6U8X1_9ACTN|nr:hypothetical protein [Micromonospora eburnea]SCL50309.1 hypothetical protein GA0070604_2102 [Micromonospora eburnea]
MKRHDSVTEELIRQARPDDRVSFTTSAQGEALVARILDTPRQPRRRSRRKAAGIAGVVVVGALFAGGATAAIGGYHAPTAPPEAQPANGDAFVCATEGMHRMGDTTAREGETPVDACRRTWHRIFSLDAPTHLYACVQRVKASPSPGGSVSPSPEWGRLVYVIDGQQFKNAPETCGSVGMLVAPNGN